MVNGKRHERTWEGDIKMGKKAVVKARAGFVWLRIGKRGGLFVNVVMDLRFHKLRKISSLSEQLSAFQQGLCCVELVEVWKRYSFSWDMMPVRCVIGCRRRLETT